MCESTAEIVIVTAMDDRNIVFDSNDAVDLKQPAGKFRVQNLAG